MTSESIHTVFISSTFEDLREERAEVQKAVLRLGCLPIGMELFPSADESAWGFIKGEIERSDYYVLIVGSRYGSVDTDGVSFTEKEYRFAKQIGKPCLVFVRSDSQEIGQAKLEQDDKKRRRLKQFVTELNASHLSQRFESRHQLGWDAHFSLNKLRVDRPVPGYVRAGFLPENRSEWLEQENQTLKAENARLSSKTVTLQEQLMQVLDELNGIKGEKKGNSADDSSSGTNPGFFEGYAQPLFPEGPLDIPGVDVGLSFVIYARYLMMSVQAGVWATCNDTMSRLEDVLRDGLKKEVIPALIRKGIVPHGSQPLLEEELLTFGRNKMLRNHFVDLGLVVRGYAGWSLTPLGRREHGALSPKYADFFSDRAPV